MIEYSQYVANGDSTFVSNPYFAVETRMRACDSMVFRIPILDMDEDANMAGIAGFAIRPLVTDPVPVKPTDAPTTRPPTQPPTTAVPTTIIPTTHLPTTQLPTTQPPVEIAVSPAGLVTDPLTTQTISITSGLCSSYQGTEFILRGLPALKSIVIGDNCFRYVSTLSLTYWTD